MVQGSTQKALWRNFQMQLIKMEGYRSTNYGMFMSIHVQMKIKEQTRLCDTQGVFFYIKEKVTALESEVMASTLKINTLTGVTTAGSIAVTGEGNSTTTNLQQGLCKGMV